MAFGVLDTKYIDLPSNMDAAYIQGMTTRAGVDFPRVLRELDARLGAFNGGLDPLVASLIRTTTELTVDDTGPVAFEVNERGEYTLARPQLTDVSAHPLPIRGYDVSLGFTEDGLEMMRLERILTNVDSVLLGLRTQQRKSIFKRLFGSTEVRVDPRTTMTSPGFAGSGTGGNAFTRPYPDGTALPGGYTHYYAANTSNAGALRTALRSAVDRLKKWYQPPFDLIAPQVALDLIIALGSPDFVASGSVLVRQGSGTAEAVLDPAVYIGALFGEVRVRAAITDTTSPNIAIFKSFGALADNNPLAWRFDPLKGRDAIVRSRTLYPLEQATVKMDFGIGVNNRTAAALIYAAAGAASYTDPTDL